MSALNLNFENKYKAFDLLFQSVDDYTTAEFKKVVKDRVKTMHGLAYDPEKLETDDKQELIDRIRKRLCCLGKMVDQVSSYNSPEEKAERLIKYYKKASSISFQTAIA